jgi:hypothetical protein
METGNLSISKGKDGEFRNGMRKRPLSVTIIGWFFIAAGTIGLVYHATEFKFGGRFQYDVLWVCLVRMLAILCGVFMLRGKSWARWLLLVWIAYHIVLSAFHSMSDVISHSILFVVVAYLLLRREASGYFRGAD